MIVAVIDGPFDADALAGVLANPPMILGSAPCSTTSPGACEHGTFILGILGARQDAAIPGLCPECELLHVPIYRAMSEASADMDELAWAIEAAVARGARLVNCSLGLIGESALRHDGLAAALDFAESQGALIVAAAGNGGRLARDQLLAHSATIPVSAVDQFGKPTPESNYGPDLVTRGVAAIGRDVPGYARGGGFTMMSGTSVAAAIATGTMARVWTQRPQADAKAMAQAVKSLGPRGIAGAPKIDPDQLLLSLDRVLARGQHLIRCKRRVSMSASSNSMSFPSSPVVLPASCGCGGGCECGSRGGGLTGFVYAIGTVEMECPSLAVEREMLTLGQTLGVATDLNSRPTEDRQWQYAVLSRNRKLSRYLVRQLSWRLTIEGYPQFVLSPRDPEDFDALVDCLNRARYAKKGSSMVLQDLDVVVGVTGADSSNGVEVKFDQIFNIAPGDLGLKTPITDLAQLADNRGVADGDRAYNYLIARYDFSSANMKPVATDFELVGVTIEPSRLGDGRRRVVRVVFTFNGHGPNLNITQRYFVRVDVTEEFPFIAMPWTRHLERGVTP